MKKTKFIKEWRATRGENYSYLSNFVSNYSVSALLMHKALSQFRNQDAIIQQSIRNYIISIASCLETFYRDLFNYVLSFDEATLERTLPELKAKPTYSDIHSLLQDGITFSEIAAAEANFQNIQEIDLLMSKLFYPHSYLDSLEASTCEFILPTRGIRSRVQFSQMWNNWKSDFSNIFQHRHSFVHNANKPCEIKFKEIQNLESLALVVAQITSELVIHKFPIKGALRGNGLPVLLLMEDLISEDWEIATSKDGIQFEK